MGTCIKKYRKIAGLTQEQLAEKMEVSVTSVRNWESGKQKIDPSRYSSLAYFLNISPETLVLELLQEGDQSRQDKWPSFLFDQETNDLVNTLHLNLAQQELFGLLYIYDSDFLTWECTDFDALKKDLAKLPYGFIEKRGSLQTLNLLDGLVWVLQYVTPDFLLKVLRQDPDKEFHVRKLNKNLICEFLDSGHKSLDWDMDFDRPRGFLDDEREVTEFNPSVSMARSKILLPVLENVGPVHLTDGHWANPIRCDLPEELLSALLKMCHFDKEMFDKGYYEKEFNPLYIRNGLELVTDYKRGPSPKEKDPAKDTSPGEPASQGPPWIWEINDLGKRLLEWFREP